MNLEEEVTFAFAAWSRFDEAVTDTLLRAVTGAFALVAASDGNLSNSEVDRFMDVMRQQAKSMVALDFAAMEQTFRDICKGLISEPVQGRERAIDCVKAARPHEIYRELVRSAAVIAMRADGRETDDELAVLDEICIALGLKAP